MEIYPWRRRARFLSDKLEAEESPGAVAMRALALAKHRAALADFDWFCEVKAEDAEKIAALAGELPSAARMVILVRLAAALSAKGHLQEGERLIDSLKAFRQWPLADPENLLLPWAVLLSYHPSLLSALNRRAGTDVETLPDLLATHAGDDALLKLVEIAASERSWTFLSDLIWKMSVRGRLAALRRAEEVSFDCLSGEIAAEDKESAAQMRWRIQASVAGLLIKRATILPGRAGLSAEVPEEVIRKETEALAYCKDRFADWRAEAGKSAWVLKNLRLLRLILSTPPDSTCNPGYWWYLASQLADATDLAEIRPFFRKLQASDWKEISYHAQELTGRAMTTGETDIAEEILSHLPARAAKSLRLKLQRISPAGGAGPAADPSPMAFLKTGLAAVEEGRTEDAAEAALRGIDASKAIRSVNARRDMQFRLAACLLHSDQPGKGLTFVRKYTERAVDTEGAVGRIHEFLDVCQMMGKDTVSLVARRCPTHGKRYKDWDFPDSLMSHAVARCFYTEGFKAVLALAESVSQGDARDEVLYSLRCCGGWDDQVPDVVELLRFQNRGEASPAECHAQFVESAKTWDFAKLRELALALTEELGSQTGAEALAAIHDIRSHLEHVPRGGTPTAAWPEMVPGKAEAEQCFPACLWDEHAPREETEGRLAAGECEKRGYPAWTQGIFEPQPELLEHGKDRAMEWMRVEAGVRERVRGTWTEPPTPEKLWYSGVLSSSDVIVAAKIAWAEGGAVEAERWASAILRSAEAFLPKGPGLVIFLLNNLAGLHFGGVPLPEGFDSLVERLFELLGLRYFAAVEESAHALARMCVATRKWDLFAEILFHSAVSGNFQCECLRNLAWLLPDEFLLKWRGEFARSPGLAHLFMEAWSMRGVSFNGRPLKEAAVLDWSTFEK